MSARQPRNVPDSGSPMDPDDEVTGADASSSAEAPKTAEDRKAAAALASLDAVPREDEAAAANHQVDSAAVSRAIKTAPAGGAAAAGPAKKVKVDSADVTLVVSGTNLCHVLLAPWICHEAKRAVACPESGLPGLSFLAAR